MVALISGFDFPNLREIYPRPLMHPACCQQPRPPDIIILPPLYLLYIKIKREYNLVNRSGKKEVIAGG
jgi:hypothetical protein